MGIVARFSSGGSGAIEVYDPRSQTPEEAQETSAKNAEVFLSGRRWTPEQGLRLIDLIKQGIEWKAPVRLSVDDEGYNPEIGQRCIVYLDGVEMQRVIGYDIEAGTITRAKEDANGNLVAEAGEIVIETLTGHVEVTMSPECSKR